MNMNIAFAGIPVINLDLAGRRVYDTRVDGPCQGAFWTNLDGHCFHSPGEASNVCFDFFR